MNKKKRFGVGFIGSVIFHLLAAVLLAVLGLLIVPQPKDKVIEMEMVDMAGGGGGGGGGGAVIVPHKSPPAPKTEPDAITEKKENEPEQTQPETGQNNSTEETAAPQGAVAGDGGGSGTGTGGGNGSGNGTGNGSGSGSGSGSGGGNGSGVGDGNGDYDNSAGASGSGSAHYDEDAVERGIQGSVTVRGLLGADGSIQSASVIESSGNSTIDNMGIRDMYAGSYSPARNKEGKPIASYVRRTFTYKLR